VMMVRLHLVERVKRSRVQTFRGHLRWLDEAPLPKWRGASVPTPRLPSCCARAEDVRNVVVDEMRERMTRRSRIARQV
jgi:hypothetical protein